MITNFKIYENVNYGKLYTILEDILNDKEDIKIIEKYIDLDFDYKIEYLLDKNQFELQLNEEDLENMVGMENGIIQYIMSLNSQYNGYEHYVEKDELEYVGNYLSGDTLKEIEKLAWHTMIKIDINKEGEILGLLEILGLKGVIDDMLSEIGMEHERAVEETASEVIDNLPFELGYPRYSRSFNLELTFDVGHMMDFIKKNNLEIDNVENFITKLDFDEFSYEITSNSYENLGDFSDLNDSVYNNIENFVSSPDELFPEFVKSDILEMFEKLVDEDYLIDDAYFNYYYSYFDKSYNRQNYTLFQIAKDKNKSILKFFKSYKFQQWYLKDLSINDKVERYKQLANDDIVNPKIVDKYEYLVGGEKYNL